MTDSPSASRAGAPADGSRPLADRRILVHLTGLLTVTLSGSVWKSAAVLTSRRGLPGAGVMDAGVPVVRMAALAAAAIWLSVLLQRRAPEPRWAVITVRWVGALSVVMPAVPAVAATVIYRLGFTVLVAWLAVEIARSHGLHRQLLTRDSGSRQNPTTAWAVTMAGLCWSMMLTSACFPLLAGSTRALEAAQEQGLEWPHDGGGLILPFASIAYTCVLEELVLVAAVCVLGRAGGCPWWLIAVVSVGCRVAVHAYLGLPALAVVILGASSLALYHRYGRLLPLMAAHAAFDTAVVLASR